METDKANTINGDFSPSREAASQGEFITITDSGREAIGRDRGSGWESSFKFSVRKRPLRVEILSCREVFESQSLRFVFERLGADQAVAISWCEGGVATTFAFAGFGFGTLGSLHGLRFFGFGGLGLG